MKQDRCTRSTHDSLVWPCTEPETESELQLANVTPILERLLHVAVEQVFAEFRYRNDRQSLPRPWRAFATFN